MRPTDLVYTAFHSRTPHRRVSTWQAYLNFQGFADFDPADRSWLRAAEGALDRYGVYEGGGRRSERMGAYFIAALRAGVQSRMLPDDPIYFAWRDVHPDPTTMRWADFPRDENPSYAASLERGLARRGIFEGGGGAQPSFVVLALRKNQLS